MKLWSNSFDSGAAIPAANAFGKYNPESHVELADNKNPHLAWSELPDGTRSLVLLCCDVNVPSSGDKVNKEGVTVPAELPRVDFYHWVVVDIPATLSALPEGAFSEGITARGKSGPSGPYDTRCGVNNYTQWFEGDSDMSGDYYGYDGPCPPWNDELVHHYHFTLYALDVDSCAVQGRFDGPAVLAAIEGHVLDKASIVGSYHIYPDAR